MAPQEQKHKVQVVVPKRADGTTVYAAHKAMPEGASDHEFTDAELVDVFGRGELVVMQNGKQVKAHQDLEGGKPFSLDDIDDPEEKAKADPNSALNAVKRASASHAKQSHKGVISAPSPTLEAGNAEPSYDGTHADGSTKEPDGVTETTTPLPGGATLKSKTTTTTGPNADTSVPFEDLPSSSDSKSSGGKHGKRY